MKRSNNANGLSRTDRKLIIFGKAAGIVKPGQGVKCYNKVVTGVANKIY